MNKGKETLTKQKILKFFGFLFLVALFSAFAVAQPIIVPTSQIHPKPKVNSEAPPAYPIIAPNELSPIAEMPTGRQGQRMENDDDWPVEKFIAVEGKVNIEMCVSEGKIRINGWDRDEIRVFVNRGSKAGFKVLKKNAQNKPVWVRVLGFDPLKDKGRDLDPCLSGEIELDVPRGAILSKFEGIETMLTVESIMKVVIRNNEGDVQIRDIEQGVEVKTFEGDISVENSGGSINLDSVNGSILVNKVESDRVGDIFKSKTNSGTITLQAVGHAMVEVNSVTGLIKFTGGVLSDGQYKFNNTTGQILLIVPSETSCLLEVVAEKNKFSTDFQFIRKDISSASSTLEKVSGQIGDGEATIVLWSQSGRIILKKSK